MIEVLNTIICYDNMEEIIDYVNKVRRLQECKRMAIVVVVNKLEKEKRDELSVELSKIDLDIYIIEPEKNLGYIKGMLEGYKQVIDQIKGNLKYVIMSNTDINFPQSDFISRLLSSTYENDVWCIGPAVYVPKRNNFDNPICEKRRSIKAVKKIIKHLRMPIINELYFRAANIKGKFIKRKRGVSQKVYEVHGCFFVVKTALAEEMLKRPFRAFLYSEEAYVAETVLQNGKITYYDAELLVEHIEHSVTGKIAYRKLAKYIADSMEIIMKDYYN